MFSVSFLHLNHTRIRIQFQCNALNCRKTFFSFSIFTYLSKTHTTYYIWSGDDMIWWRKTSSKYNRSSTKFNLMLPLVSPWIFACPIPQIPAHFLYTVFCPAPLKKTIIIITLNCLFYRPHPFNYQFISWLVIVLGEGYDSFRKYFRCGQI